MRPRIAGTAVIPFVVFLFIFLLSRTSNFTGPHDSIAYLEMLKTRNHLWHPHHLLYHELTYYWLHFWKIFFPNAQEYFIVESFSSVFGAGTMAMVFLFFRKRFNLPLLTSWLGTAIVAFSFGIWFYSINVEVYAPSLFFTLCALYQMARKDWDARAVWLTAILHSLAILFHQMNILLTPIVIYKIIEQRKNIYVVKSLFWYALTGIVLVGGVYFLAGRFGEGHADLAGWITWMRGYTVTDEYWRPLSWKTPLLAGTGFAHTFLGGHFVFRIGLERWFTSLLHTHSLQDEFFLAKDLPRNFSRVLFVLAVVLIALMFFLFIKFVSRIGWLVRNQYFVVVPLILYFLVYSFYFLFWMPEILEFWLGQCIVFWLLVIGTCEKVNPRLHVLLACILGLLFFINFTGSIRPMQNINNDIGYVRIQKVRAMAKSNDLVIVQNPWLLKEFLEYYTPASVAEQPRDKNQRDSLQQVADHDLQAGGKIFIFLDKENPRADRDTSFIPALMNANKPRTSQLQSEPAEVWIIQ